MNNRWVIPDIHGCSKTLKSLIETHIKPSRFDELFFLGDYIDRGPDSKGVIDYIMELQKKEYSIRLLLGNHEDYCIKAWDEDKKKKKYFGLSFKTKVQSIWELHGGKETLESFGVRFASEIPEIYIEWMREQRLYIELENYILVHAGLNFTIDDPLTDRFAMLWTKDFKVIPSKIRNKKVIHGHTPVDLEFLDHVIKNKTYNFIDLDNGVYMLNRAGYGNLVAFEINSGRYLVQPNLDY
ncbi:MAG: serine/threonine protein phosphatase [Bacteroidetes bacterium]|jgi:serine/threonine protein phosphatase 1|nr:serine/threonine protein phosphatase [Bacteroidota bacterium]